MNFARLLERSARRAPDAPALALGRRVVRRYGAFAERVARTAAGLVRRHQLVRGDRVGLASKNCVAYYEALFACWHAGLVAVPINAKLHPKEFAYILENSGAKLCFVSEALEAAIAPVVPVVRFDSAQAEALGSGEPAPLVEVGPDELAWLFYTSGTTGVPKGAMLTHRNLLFAVQAYFADIDKLGPQDANLHSAPLSHGSGFYGLAHIAAGGVNVIPESGQFDPEEIFELIDAWPNTSFFAAPTMLVRLLGSPAARAVPNLRTISYGGAPMYVSDALRAIDLFGPRLYQLFGQGESPMTITGLPQEYHADRAHPRFHERLASTGFARLGVEVRIVDDHERELSVGEVGEILTRSDCMMAGYWQNPDATREALRGGWLHTGDMGSLDAEGLLTLRDRSKDMIISGGSNIYPREIEEVLLRHPGVVECSVVGRPHAEWGEEVVAFVVRREGDPVDAPALDAQCMDAIARFKRPRQYRFVDALPKNNYGKVLKTELRRQLNDAD